MMNSCATLNCGRDNGCCTTYGEISYCLVQSQCKTDPLWQAIVIPAVLFFFAVILIILVIFKLKNASKTSMKVHNFAQKQIRVQRMQTKLSEKRFNTFVTQQTLTSVV